MSDVTSPDRTDDPLRAGKPGLRFFALFAPLYSRYTGRTVDYEYDVAAPYRSLSGTALDDLREDAVRFAAAADALVELRGEVGGELTRLGAQWTGPAAEETLGHAAAVLREAEAAGAEVAALAAVTGDLVDALAEQVRSRAEVMLGLAGGMTCGGLDHVAVAALVDVVMGPADVQEVSRSVAAATELLDECFVPEFEARLAQFRDEALTGVEDDVRGVWSDLAASTGGPVSTGTACADPAAGGATLGSAGDGDARLGVAPPHGGGAALGVAGPDGSGAVLGAVPDPAAPQRVAAVSPVPGDEPVPSATVRDRAAREKLRHALVEIADPAER